MKTILRALLPIIFAVALVGSYLRLTGTAIGALLSQYELYVFFILFLFLRYSWYVHLILHEGGHYLFGKLTGYRLLSFQVKKFVYSEKNKKITYIQSGPTVIAGQCLMSPPPKGSYAEKPFKLYLLGGVMVNGLTGIALYGCSYLLAPERGIILVLFSLVPLWMALSNIWPYGQNDGAIVSQASRSAEAKELLFYQLEIAALFEEGATFTELPERYFQPLEEGRYLKTNLADFVYMAAYLRALGVLDFEEADRLLQSFEANRPVARSAYWPIFAVESLFCDAVFGRKQAAQEKYAKIQNNLVLKQQWNTSKRVQAAYAFFVEVDMRRAKALLKQAKQNLDGLAMPAEKEIEKRLTEWLQGYFVS